MYGIKEVHCAVVNNSYSAGSCEPTYIPPTHPWREEREMKAEIEARVRREEGGRQDPEDKSGGGAR
jgi:hypothetical protein